MSRAPSTRPPGNTILCPDIAGSGPAPGREMPRRLPSTRHKEHARVKPRLSIRRLGADRAPQRWRSSGFRPPGIGSVGPCSPAMGVYWDILGPFVKIPHFGRLALTLQTFIDFHRVSPVNHKKAERVGSARKKNPEQYQGIHNRYETKCPGSELSSDRSEGGSRVRLQPR